MKLTETNVAALRLSDGRTEGVIWDDEVTGFGVRIQAGATKGSYVVHFRVAGKQRKITIAKVGKITLKAAKLKAQEYLLQAANNVDPVVQIRKAQRATSGSIKQMIQPFLDHLESDKKRASSYVDDNRRTLETRMTKIHTLAPDDVDRETVAGELRTIKSEHGPVAMNRARSHLSKFFNWMIGEGAASANPVTGTNRNEEGFRDRLLDPAEIVKIWNAANSNNQFDKIVRLLILTTARRTQIGGLQKAEVIRTDERNMIELPGLTGRSKNKQKFRLPLSTQALAIIDSLDEREESEFVFGRGKGGFSGWSNCKERFDETVGVKDWVFHDFRAAFDTYSQDLLKVPHHIADLLLNHKGAEVRKGTKKHYNFALYYDEKAEAMQKWGDYVESLVKPRLRIAA